MAIKKMGTGQLACSLEFNHQRGADIEWHLSIAIRIAMFETRPASRPLLLPTATTPRRSGRGWEVLAVAVPGL